LACARPHARCGVPFFKGAIQVCRGLRVAKLVHRMCGSQARPRASVLRKEPRQRRNRFALAQLAQRLRGLHRHRFFGDRQQRLQHRALRAIANLTKRSDGAQPSVQDVARELLLQDRQGSLLRLRELARPQPGLRVLISAIQPIAQIPAGRSQDDQQRCRRRQDAAQRQPLAVDDEV
jgi:hypothetical protein